MSLLRSVLEKPYFEWYVPSAPEELLEKFTHHQREVENQRLKLAGSKNSWRLMVFRVLEETNVFYEIIEEP